MPELTDRQHTEAELKEMYPEDTGEHILIPDLLTEQNAREYLRLKAEKSAIEAKMLDLKLKIEAVMGTASEGVAGDYVITWKTQERGQVVIPPCKPRVFNIKARPRA
jgi:hypothetical protein